MPTIQCPGCSRRFKFSEENTGRVTQCPSCSQRITLQASRDETIVSNRPQTDTRVVPPPVVESQRPAKLPKHLGRFEIHALLGSGAFGVVYRARDPVLRRDVALKVPHPAILHNENAAARLLQEPQAAAQLRHPNIIPVYDAGSDGQNYYIASAFIDGKTLEEVLKKGKFAFRQSARIVQQLAEALDYAHEQGIVHRDVKPANIMLDKSGVPHLMDFGIARWEHADDKLTMDGSVLGTPAYMSPEQTGGAKGRVGPPSDQYSLGVVLYELLCHERPFDSHQALGLLFHLIREKEPPPPSSRNPAVTRDLETICLKAMAKEPESRYASCRDLAEDLQRFINDEPIRARPLGPVERLVRWSRRNPLVAGLTAAVIVVTLVGFAAVTWQWRSARANFVEAEHQRQLAETNLKEAKTQRELAEQRLQQITKTQNERILAQVDALQRAEITEVPLILQNLAPFRTEVAPRLVELAGRNDLSEKAMLRVRVGLLPDDPAQVPFLRDKLLTAEPDELLVLREALTPHHSQITPHLWQLLSDPTGTSDVRLRAACVLAAHDSQSDRWSAASGSVADALVTQNPLLLGRWMEALRPVRGVLTPSLSRIFADTQRSQTERSLTADVLADFAADQPDLLVELIKHAEGRHYGTLLAKLKPHQQLAIDKLAAELETAPSGSTSTPKTAEAAPGRANLAVALLQLGQQDRVWPLFKHSPDPTLRSYLIHRCALLGVDPSVIAQRLSRESDVSIRRALILSLGEYRVEQIPSGQVQSLIAKLLRDYQTDPDPGFHAAAEWTLRQWKREEELTKISGQLAGGQPATDRRWYVTGQGHTMVIVPGPMEFVMGSPETEANRLEDEGQHRRRIGRSFAISAKEVTVEQFQRFLAENPQVEHYYDKNFSPDATGPQTSVTWYEAAAYCNWLSQKEGIAQKEWCYPSKLVEGMALPTGYLSRRGYRLPTEAEWEYACRAGALTSRYFGESEELLGHYAWFFSNSNDRAWPAGGLKPNELGLFDMLGNVWEWCQDRPLSHPSSGADDAEDTANVQDSEGRVLRGGSFSYDARDVRSADRLTYRPGVRVNNDGFRLARTYP